MKIKTQHTTFYGTQLSAYTEKQPERTSSQNDDVYWEQASIAMGICEQSIIGLFKEVEANGLS